jgi:hypothetical protein
LFILFLLLNAFVFTFIAVVIVIVIITKWYAQLWDCKLEID